VNARRLRQSVRALIVDPAERVLLVRFEFPDATVWALPGGGVEPDEEPLDALHRELDEELGLVGADIGPQVWERTHLITFDHGPDAARWDGQHDRVYLVRSGAFEPRPRLSWEQLRAERLHEIRWWSVPELHAADVWFAPRRLGHHLETLLRDGPPSTPVDTGI
jgi:8-oxo-dGTP diphosphatase